MSISGLSGQKLAGVYALKTPIAHGAHGVVYEARHVVTGGRYALKIFHPDVLTPERLSRCRRDAEMAAALHHPGIVRVVDWSRRDVLPLIFVVSEFAEGESVQSRIRRFGRLSPLQALELGIRVGMTLSAAHKLGVVHQGLTPRNLLYTVPASDATGSPSSASSLSAPSPNDQGEGVGILDFGVAQLGSLPWLVRDNLPYRAPEQDYQDEEVDARVDQYALAAILYEALTGRPPQIHDEIELDQADGGEPVRLPPSLAVCCPEAPRHMVEAIERALSPIRHDRFPSMIDFIHGLEDRGASRWRPSSVSSSLSRRSPLSALSPAILASQGSQVSPLLLAGVSTASGGSFPEPIRLSARSGASAASVAGRPAGPASVIPLSSASLRRSAITAPLRPGSAQSNRPGNGQGNNQGHKKTSDQTRPGSGPPDSSVSMPREGALSGQSTSRLASTAPATNSGSSTSSSKIKTSGLSLGRQAAASGRTLPLSPPAPSSRSASAHSLTPVVRPGEGRKKSSPLFTGVGLAIIVALTIYLAAGSRSDQRASTLTSSETPRPAPRPEPVPSVASGEGALSPQDIQATLTEADKALDDGENVHAIELARTTLPSSRAWGIIGVAACRISDTQLAKEALQHLGPAERPDVESACRIP